MQSGEGEWFKTFKSYSEKLQWGRLGLPVVLLKAKNVIREYPDDHSKKVRMIAILVQYTLSTVVHINLQRMLTGFV